MRNVMPIAVFVASLVAFSSPARATLLLGSLSLEETTRQADRIAYGKVTDVRVATDDAGLTATWVTLEVRRGLKGVAAGNLTIKQFGDCSAADLQPIGRVPGLPLYVPGEEIVFFLRGNSARGFTSPVGFEGGIYRVHVVGTRRSARSVGSPADENLETLLGKVADIVQRQSTEE